jgi:hypothetical protein
MFPDQNRSALKAAHCIPNSDRSDIDEPLGYKLKLEHLLERK